MGHCRWGGSNFFLCQIPLHMTLAVWRRSSFGVIYRSSCIWNYSFATDWLLDWNSSNTQHHSRRCESLPIVGGQSRGGLEHCVSSVFKFITAACWSVTQLNGLSFLVNLRKGSAIVAELAIWRLYYPARPENDFTALTLPGAGKLSTAAILASLGCVPGLLTLRSEKVIFLCPKKHLTGFNFSPSILFRERTSTKCWK